MQPTAVFASVADGRWLTTTWAYFQLTRGDWQFALVAWLLLSQRSEDTSIATLWRHGRTNAPSLLKARVAIATGDAVR